MKTETIQKVKSFLEFEKGWYFGKGNEFKQEVINLAIKIINNIKYETDVFPGESGEIMVSIYNNEWYYEFIIEHDLRIDFVSYKDDVLFNYKENIDITESIKIITKINSHHI